MSRFINKILFDFVNFGKNAEAERHEWRLSFSFMHVSYDVCFCLAFMIPVEALFWPMATYSVDLDITIFKIHFQLGRKFIQILAIVSFFFL